MSPHQQPTIEEYIAHKRHAGVPDQQIYTQLVQHGWDPNEVTRLLTDDVPTPPAPAPYHQYAQTGNTGQPIQVENVQYNMTMKPVESKIGLYMRLTMLGLWVSVTAACVFLAQLISKTANSGTDMGMTAVVVISFLAVSLPIFWFANQKRLAAMQKDPRLVDDLFYKKRVRKSLRFAIILTAIAGFISVFTLLSMLFLKNDNSSTKVQDFFAALVYTAGFGGILAFTWKLHAKTQR